MGKIRMAAAQDAEGILNIYRGYVENSWISMEYKAPSVSEMAGRVEGILRKYPYLVYEAERRIVGYAYASEHMARKGYQWDVQSSVYVQENSHGKQVGLRLYQCLLDMLQKQGFCNVYAIITIPNEKSVSFHEKQGFYQCALLKRTAYKFDQWFDIIWMVKHLQHEFYSPGNILPLAEINGSI